MNNTQLYLSIGLPTATGLITLIVVILAWLSSRSDISDLRAEMNGRLDRVEAKIDKTANELRVEMNGLRREIHQDMIPLHERMAKLEVKQ